MRKLLSLLVCFGIAASSGRVSVLAADQQEPLAALVEVLKDSRDPQMQLDILKGMSAALKGRRWGAMPGGGRDGEPRLTASKNAEISTLAQTLGLTFGSRKALAALRETALNSRSEIPV